MTSDPSGGTPTYGSPVQIVGAKQANMNPNSSTAVDYADDGPSEVSTTLGQSEIELMLSEVPIAIAGILLGHTVTGGVMVKDASDIPPYVAIGFRSQKGDGTYRYKWLPKIKFREGQQNHNTKGESLEFQPDTLIGSYVKRVSDGAYEIQADEGQDGLPQATIDAWFTDVYGSTPDTVAPTVVFDPVHDATGEALDVEPTFTFSEAMDENTMIPANFMLTEVTDGSPVACTFSYAVGTYIMTMTPDAVLTASTEYQLTVSVACKDLSGNPLAATNTAQFTTTA